MARVKIITELPIEETVLVCIRNENGQLEQVGDLTLMANGHAVVMNDWGGGLEFFDTHDEAMRYIKGRMAPEPLFAREQAPQPRKSAAKQKQSKPKSSIFDKSYMNLVLSRMSDPHYVARLEELANWYNSNVDGLEGKALYELNVLCLQLEDEIASEMGWAGSLVASDAVIKMGMRYTVADHQ